jgi:hypothetical protein
MQEKEGEDHLDQSCELRRSSILRRVKEEWNIKHTIKKRNGNRVGYILCTNCCLKHVLKFWQRTTTDIKAGSRAAFVNITISVPNFLNCRVIFYGMYT